MQERSALSARCESICGGVQRAPCGAFVSYFTQRGVLVVPVPAVQHGLCACAVGFAAATLLQARSQMRARHRPAARRPRGGMFVHLVNWFARARQNEGQHHAVFRVPRHHAAARRVVGAERSGQRLPGGHHGAQRRLVKLHLPLRSRWWGKGEAFVGETLFRSPRSANLERPKAWITEKAGLHRKVNGSHPSWRLCCQVLDCGGPCLSCACLLLKSLSLLCTIVSCWSRPRTI